MVICISLHGSLVTFWLYVIIISVVEPICHILSLGKGSECEQANYSSHSFAKREMSVRENELYLL